jgi:hypothetical protein
MQWLCEATRGIRAKKISNWQRVRSIASAATLIFKKCPADAGFLDRRACIAFQMPRKIVCIQIATAIQTFAAPERLGTVTQVSYRNHTRGATAFAA